VSVYTLKYRQATARRKPLNLEGDLAHVHTGRGLGLNKDDSNCLDPCRPIRSRRGKRIKGVLKAIGGFNTPETYQLLRTYPSLSLEGKSDDVSQLIKVSKTFVSCIASVKNPPIQFRKVPGGGRGVFEERLFCKGNIRTTGRTRPAVLGKNNFQRSDSSLRWVDRRGQSQAGSAPRTFESEIGIPAQNLNNCSERLPGMGCHASKKKKEASKGGVGYLPP